MALMQSVAVPIMNSIPAVINYLIFTYVTTHFGHYFTLANDSNAERKIVNLEIFRLFFNCYG